MPAAEEAPERVVLVVDDSLASRSLEQAMLESAGFRVLTATDGLGDLLLSL